MCGMVTDTTNGNGDSDEGYVRQTFTFAKVFKDSKVGEAGVMLDLQQVLFVLEWTRSYGASVGVFHFYVNCLCASIRAQLA